MIFKEFFYESNRELTSVYHVSPRSDMFKLRPISHRKGVRAYIGKGEPGIFVAPKFKDAVAWATSYVGGKKQDTQRPNERLKEKGGGRHGDGFEGVYKKLTIYEIKVPKEVLKNSVYTSWWEPEYFIPASSMDLMTIVGSRTYSIYELSKMQRRRDNVRYDFYPNQDSYILKASKTNFAARYYLDLKSLYNSYLLKGNTPLIDEDLPAVPSDSTHVINKEIDKLKNFIFERRSDMRVKTVQFLNRLQESQAKELYEKIKVMIQSL